jgi:hypothetical protein
MLYDRQNGARQCMSLYAALGAAFGLAIDTITGFVTAPGAVLTPWTLAAGDSLSVRNCDFTKRVRLLDMWFFNQAAGIGRVRSPKLHDNVQGLRVRIPGNSNAFPLQPTPYPQAMYPQDQLIVEQSGSAVAGQIETGSLLMWYEDLPGVNAHLVTADEVNKRGVELENIETNHVAGVAGGYSGQVAINANFDLLKANTDYAIIGYVTDAQFATVGWRGADTGNLRVSGPANNLLRDITRRWFWDLASILGLPCIPVFNSANKGGFLVDVVNNQAALSPNVNTICVELAPSK